jgi:hypothetical protein
VQSVGTARARSLSMTLSDATIREALLY